MTPANLYEGTLDDARLDALVDDWSGCAQVVEVRCKQGPTTHADQPVALADAVALLRARRCRAVQVRYEWEGAMWSDTLLAAPQGFRLVRMQEPTRPPADA